MFRRLFIATSLIVMATPLAASVDRSPPPGGVYRLKPGIYVAKGADRGSPPNAAILTYDGKGLSDPHSHARVARVLARKGRQSCRDASGVIRGAGSDVSLFHVGDAFIYAGKIALEGRGIVR